MRACPLNQLHRTASDEPIIFGCSSKQTEQIKRSTIRRILATWHINTPACVTIEHSQEMRRVVRLGNLVMNPDP
jgi:hypothetical protein